MQTDLTVGQVVFACEYIGCDIVDAFGELITITKENMDEIYALNVEHINAVNNNVIIWTFVRFDEMIHEQFEMKRQNSAV